MTPTGPDPVETAGSPHFTERMEPGDAHPRVFWEHRERYRFAARFAPGRRVLDVASGEGYGTSALVRAGARSAIGVDLAADVCDRARRKYGLDFREGDAQAIPVDDDSVDLVVSFETIEHVDDPARLVAEAARVLTPTGRLVISSPNRPVYTGDGPTNPFHHIEFDARGFDDLLRTRFATVQMFGQTPRTAAWWSPRSLAAERSPWHRIKGFWRFSTWVCPELRSTIPPEVRAHADDLARGDHRGLSALFNPYRVRPLATGAGEQPYFLVAVAEGPRDRG